MRRLVLAGAIFGALAAMPVTTPAMAQNMPWCMVDALKSGHISCAYVSFEQCSISARAGNVGYCIDNPYRPAVAPAQPKQTSKRTRPRTY